MAMKIQLNKKKRIVIHAISNTVWNVEDPESKTEYGPYSPKVALYVRDRLERGLPPSNENDYEREMKEEQEKEKDDQNNESGAD